MKKIITTIALSLSALMATSAMAASDHRYDDQQRYHNHTQDNRWNNNNNHYDHDRYDNKRVNPSRDWRVGQTLPRQYSSSRFQVSDREARRLAKIGRYQQWYKVNGDYVLVNERNNRILRIQN